MRRYTRSMAEAAGQASALLVEGDTCWRVARAERAAVLVDGEAYFGALAAALERAERSILIVGWDLHGGMRLRRGADGDDGPTLVDQLDGLVRRRRGLRAHVLEWDFALLYALERQILPNVRFGLATHRRLHFRLDAEHPLGGSHHQKLVVIDDRIAFCGGLDLSICRWDTREHRAADPRRCDPGRRDYAAFHDVQMLVDGAAAAALGELARRRWREATGARLRPRRGAGDPWPAGVEPTLRSVAVGIARTLPAAHRRPEVREVERLYLASIRAARRSIYVENQYLTASTVGDALAARLAEPDGPDVVIVSTGSCEGWLEERTMGVLRARWLARLRAADRHGRLRVLHPVVPDLPADSYKVHAKVMIVDDRLLRVGSANLANRSMGLDSECDLAIESAGDDDARAIAGVRDDLLAEHLGVSPQEVAEALRAHGSLVAAVDALSGGLRTLAPIAAELDPTLDELVPDAAVLDPEKPCGPDELLERLLPELGPPQTRSALPLVGLALAVLALASAWRFTPLAEWARPEQLAALAAPLRESRTGPLVAAAGVALASLVLVPVTALTVGSALVFGPFVGAAAVWAGALASAALGFGIGRSLWGELVRRVVGRRGRLVRDALSRQGLLTVAALRLVPLAPFTVLNVAAGASPLRFRDYLAGSALGMAPGVLLLAFAADRARQAVVDPGFWSFAALTAVLVAGWAGFAWARRRFARSGT